MVEWKKLGDIAKRNKGIPITAGQMSELNTSNGNVRVFAAGQTLADINENDLPENCAHLKPSIIVKSRGYIDFVFYEKPFTHKNEMWSYSFDDREEGKFLYYYLTTKTEFFRKKAKANSVKLPQLCVADTDDYLVPYPSLQEQKRIVGILDMFTSSIDNLKQQIAQRRKQYEHYRDQLLDLEGKEGVEMKTLGEICDNLDCKRKPITSSKRKAGIYPYYGASGIVDYVEGYIFDGEYLLVSEDGANLVARTYPIAFSIKGKNWVNNHAHVLAFDSKITQKFVEIYLNMIDLSPWINGAAQPKLNQANLNIINIPVPSLSEQQRIVDILDKFEASIQNLEAQLSQREKQYEYYRNKLLTFE